MQLPPRLLERLVHRKDVIPGGIGVSRTGRLKCRGFALLPLTHRTHMMPNEQRSGLLDSLQQCESLVHYLAQRRYRVERTAPGHSAE